MKCNFYDARGESFAGVSSSSAPAASLRPALWENVFSFYPGTTLTCLQNDFITPDPDRFRVRFRDPDITADTVDLRLNSVGAAGGADDLKTVTLAKEGNGVYVSTNLLLVTDAEDAAFMTSEVFCQQLMTRAGSVIRAEYVKEGRVVSRKDVPLAPTLKTVPLDVVILRTNGVALVSQTKVQSDIETAQERYAQAGIRFTATIREVDLPPGFDLADWLIDDSLQKLSQKTKTIIDITRDPRFEKTLIFTDSLRNGNENVVLRGIALMPYYYTSVDDSSYMSVCFVSNAAQCFTLAHEIGHMLMNQGHSVWPWNLMSGNGTSTNKDPLGTKRLFLPQIQAARGSSE